jgi:hypothetical protein
MAQGARGKEAPILATDVSDAPRRRFHGAGVPVLIAAVLMVTLVAAACSGDGKEGRADGTKDQPLTSYADNGVAFEYPSSWVPQRALFDESETSWQATLGPPGPPEAAHGYFEVLAFAAPQELTPDQLRRVGDWFFKFVQNDALGDKPQGDVVPTTVAGVPALEARTIRDDGATTRATVFANGTMAYAIDCYVPPHGQVISDGCATAIKTFRFTQ